MAEVLQHSSFNSQSTQNNWNTNRNTNGYIIQYEQTLKALPSGSV